jgi:hypothetical protein
MKKPVIPAKAGIQKKHSRKDLSLNTNAMAWIPAFAGMTSV